MENGTEILQGVLSLREATEMGFDRVERDLPGSIRDSTGSNDGCATNSSV